MLKSYTFTLPILGRVPREFRTFIEESTYNDSLKGHLAMYYNGKLQFYPMIYNGEGKRPNYILKREHVLNDVFKIDDLEEFTSSFTRLSMYAYGNPDKSRFFAYIMQANPKLYPNADSILVITMTVDNEESAKVVDNLFAS